MRLKRDRFNRLTGKQPTPAPVVAKEVEPPPPPPMPAATDISVLDKRLETMEKMLRGVFISQASTDARPSLPAVQASPGVNSTLLNERLSKIEDDLQTLLDRKQGQTWDFDIKRDASGKMLSVRATKKNESEEPHLA